MSKLFGQGDARQSELISHIYCHGALVRYMVLLCLAFQVLFLLDFSCAQQGMRHGMTPTVVSVKGTPRFIPFFAPYGRLRGACRCDYVTYTLAAWRPAAQVAVALLGCHSPQQAFPFYLTCSWHFRFSDCPPRPVGQTVF